MNTPWTDLIETFPELFGKNGSKRWQIEAEAKDIGFDDDKTNGVDDDFVAWNLSEEK